MPMELAIEFFLVVCNLLINWTHSLRFFFGSVRFGWLFGQAKSLTAVARLSKLICVFAFCGMPPRRRRVLGTFPVRSFIYCLGACPARLAAHTHTHVHSHSPSSRVRDRSTTAAARRRRCDVIISNWPCFLLPVARWKHCRQHSGQPNSMTIVLCFSVWPSMN